MSDRKTATAIDEQCRHAAINGRVILSCRFDMEEHAEALDLVALGGPFLRLCIKKQPRVFARLLLREFGQGIPLADFLQTDLRLLFR